MTGLATVEFVEDNDMERGQKYPREWDDLSFSQSTRQIGRDVKVSKLTRALAHNSTHNPSAGPVRSVPAGHLRLPTSVHIDTHRQTTQRSGLVVSDSIFALFCYVDPLPITPLVRLATEF